MPLVHVEVDQQQINYSLLANVRGHRQQSQHTNIMLHLHYAIKSNVRHNTDIVVVAVKERPNVTYY